MVRLKAGGVVSRLISSQSVSLLVWRCAQTIFTRPPLTGITGDRARQSVLRASLLFVTCVSLKLYRNTFSVVQVVLVGVRMTHGRYLNVLLTGCSRCTRLCVCVCLSVGQKRVMQVTRGCGWCGVSSFKNFTEVLAHRETDEHRKVGDYYCV